MFDAEPERARQALTSIETLGREALVEMRRLLAVLWTHENGSKDQPGLAQLPALVAQVERAGLPFGSASTESPGHCRQVSSSTPTGSSRRRSPTRSSTPALLAPRSSSPITPNSSNCGSATMAGGSRDELRPGHGVVGMRQRALVLGGDVTVGPRKDRGFEVTARLPVDGERR